jgi:hypothetical protein
MSRRNTLVYSKRLAPPSPPAIGRRTKLLRLNCMENGDVATTAADPGRFSPCGLLVPGVSGTTVQFLEDKWTRHAAPARARRHRLPALQLGLCNLPLSSHPPFLPLTLRDLWLHGSHHSLLRPVRSFLYAGPITRSLTDDLFSHSFTLIHCLLRVGNRTTKKKFTLQSLSRDDPINGKPPDSGLWTLLRC